MYVLIEISAACSTVALTMVVRAMSLTTSPLQSFDYHLAHATIPSSLRKYTIRACFGEHRDAGGACWVDVSPPELSTVGEARRERFRVAE